MMVVTEELGIHPYMRNNPYRHIITILGIRGYCYNYGIGHSFDW